MRFPYDELESILRHVNFPVEFGVLCSTFHEGNKVSKSTQKEVQNLLHPA